MGSNPIEGTTSSLHLWHHWRLPLDVGGVLDVDVNLVPPKKPRFHGRIETREARLADGAKAISLEGGPQLLQVLVVARTRPAPALVAFWLQRAPAAVAVRPQARWPSRRRRAALRAFRCAHETVVSSAERGSHRRRGHRRRQGVNASDAIDAGTMWCPRWDSNPYCAGFKPGVSTSWTTRANVSRTMIAHVTAHL